MNHILTKTNCFSLTLITLLTVWCSFGQLEDIEVKKTKIVKTDYKNSSLFFTVEDESQGFFVGKTLKEGYYIEHYDKDLNLVDVFDGEVKNAMIKAVFVNEGKLILITCFKNKKSEEYEYAVLSSPLDKFVFEEKPLFNISFEDITHPWAMDLFWANNYSQIDLSSASGIVTVTENKKFITINLDLRDKGMEKHKLMVYDSAFDLVFERTFDEGIKDKNFEFSSIYTSGKDGTVYYIGKIFDEEGDKKDKESYYYKLYEIKKEGTRELVLNEGKYFVNKICLMPSDDYLVAIGMYSEERNYRYKGIAYYSINLDSLTTTSSVFSPFTEQFMIDKYGEKRGKKKEGKELRNIRFKRLYNDDKGNVYITAEVFFILQESNSNGMPMGMGAVTTTNRRYNYIDMIVCKLNKEGNLDWARDIYKYTSTTGNTSYYSFFSTLKDGKLYLAFNGRKKIADKYGDRIFFNLHRPSNMCLYLLELDEDGNIAYRMITDKRKTDQVYRVKKGAAIHNGATIILEGRHKREKDLLSITIN